MKKTTLFIAIIITALVFNSCVTAISGIITFRNLSDKTIYNINIGYNYIGYLLPGAVYNYSYMWPQQGKITAYGIDQIRVESSNSDKINPSCNFKTQCSYDTHIYLDSGKYILHVYAGKNLYYYGNQYPAN